MRTRADTASRCSGFVLRFVDRRRSCVISRIKAAPFRIRERGVAFIDLADRLATLTCEANAVLPNGANCC